MYQPSPALLKKYADVLVKFALRSGKGAKKNDVVFVQIPECAKAFYLPLQKAVLEAGAHPIMEYIPDGVAKHFFDHASEEQIKFYPSHLLHGKIAQMTHVISIIADADMYELKGIHPKKIATRINSRKQYKEKRMQKEVEGKMTRTMGMFGTPAMAKEAKLSLKEYREQIIKACYLDFKDPIAQRKKTFAGVAKIEKKLSDMQIERVHVVGKDADINIKIGADRKRMSGSGRNIPSFEIFTSPDRRGTEGWIRFNQPLYRYGEMVEGICLEFKKGIITKYSAKKNQKVLKGIISIPNANRLGEFSLTDSRFSHITKFMCETLYDENVGGKYGNTHVAVGGSFNDVLKGNIKKLKPKDFEKVGLNQCAEHVDIVSTENRTVTATLKNGSKKVIYKDGRFTI